MELIFVFGSFILVAFILYSVEYFVSQGFRFAEFLRKLSIFIITATFRYLGLGIKRMLVRPLRFVSLRTLEIQNNKLTHSNTSNMPILYENPPQHVLRKNS